MTANQILNGVGAGLATGIGAVMERILGPDVKTEVLGKATWADVGAFGCLALMVLVTNALLSWVARWWLHKGEENAAESRWKRNLLATVAAPVHLLVWVCGACMTMGPLLARIDRNTGEGPVAQGFERILSIGVFAAVVWLVVRLARVLESVLMEHAEKTKGRLDNLLAPLLGRTLRVAVPVVGVIFALPLAELPAEYAGLLAKASSMLIIGMVAWILLQTVQLGERAVLARYDIKAADNLQARKIYTQVHVLSKSMYVVIGIFTVASVLMLFEEVRRFGTSLLASAGVVGIIAGFAAQRTIANLFAGFQLAMTQPIRLDDVVIVEDEWGRIEEITLTYVVVHIWDDRRLVVPLSYFIEKPFQNWTRASADLMGSVFVWADYALPVAEVREAVGKIVASCKDWDRRFWNLQVTDMTERAMQLRVLATAADASKAWDLRCEIREKVIEFLQERHAQALPKVRAELGSGKRSVK